MSHAPITTLSLVLRKEPLGHEHDAKTEGNGAHHCDSFAPLERLHFAGPSLPCQCLVWPVAHWTTL